VAGLQLQALFRNPLAGPSVLGITAGSSVGVAAIVLWLGQGSAMRLASQWGVAGHWLMVLASAAGAMAMLLLVLAVARRVPDNASLLVVGMMAGNLSLALVGVWQYFSSPEQVKEFLFWTFGSLEGVWGAQLWAMALALLLGLIGAMLSGKSLNLLLLGDEYAQSMGLSVRKAKLGIIVSASLLAGATTAFCGPIGFVGIAVPHLARQLFKTADHRLLMPASMALGASLMLFCDSMAHLPGTQLALPINAATSLIGSPIVIWVLLRKD
jgi:iron complex transport system permease protein